MEMDPDRRVGDKVVRCVPEVLQDFKSVCLLTSMLPVGRHWLACYCKRNNWTHDLHQPLGHSEVMSSPNRDPLNWLFLVQIHCRCTAHQAWHGWNFNIQPSNHDATATQSSFSWSSLSRCGIQINMRIKKCCYRRIGNSSKNFDNRNYDVIIVSISKATKIFSLSGRC